MGETSTVVRLKIVVLLGSVVIAGLTAAGLAFTCVGRIVLKANGEGVVIHRSVD